MPPRWYRRGGVVGGWDPPLGGVDILEYCEKILPLVENLWSSLQYEVYFMGGGAAGDLEATIFDFTKNKKSG